MDIAILFSELEKSITGMQQISFYAQTYSSSKIASVELPFAQDELKGKLVQNFSFLKSDSLANKELRQYPYGDCKHEIEYCDIGKFPGKMKLEGLINSINDPDIPFNSEIFVKNFKSYAIKIVDCKGKSVLFITKKKPIYSMKKNSSLFSLVKGDTGVFKSINPQFIQLTTTIDVIVWDDKIFFITLNMEGPLGLQTYNKKQKDECITLVKEALSAEEFLSVNSLLQSKRANSFNSYSQERLNMLKDAAGKSKVAKALGISIKPNGNLDLSDSKSKELLLLYLQKKVANDVVDVNQKVVSSIPLEEI